MSEQLSFGDEPVLQAPARAASGAGSAPELPGANPVPNQQAPGIGGEPRSERTDRRVRMTIAYDGAAYHGFAANEGVATVQGALVDALERVLRRRGRVAVTGAGRTDGGVHARGQVVSFDAPDDTDLARLQRSVNGICGPSIVVRDAAFVADEFDARFSATWRRYRYTVHNAPVADPFLTRTAWHVHEPLDLWAMRLGCDPIIGEHDFTSFCRAPRPGPRDAELGPPSLVRRVYEADWHEADDDCLRFEIRANAFCHNMVRSIVGTLVDIGRGRKRAGDVTGILRAKDRARAGVVAPPQGLVLWEVGYG